MEVKKEEFKSAPKTEKSKSNLDKISPHMAFGAGIVVAIAVVAVVAVIVLALMLFNKDNDTSDARTAQANTNANINAATNAAQPVKPTGSINMDGLTNVRGTGDLIVVEYSDTECPFCKRFHETMQQVLADYSGKVRWGYKHFPLTSLHSKAPREAEATECAAEQNKFWEYIDALMAKTPSNNKLEDAELFTLADEVGLARTQFDDCLASGKYKSKVSADAAEAQAKGGRGTPYSLIVEQSSGVILDVISGALPADSVKATLDQYL